MNGGGKIRVLEMIDDAGVGGGQIHVLTLVKYLDGGLFDVSVACEGQGFLVDEVRKISLPVFPILLNNRPGTSGFRDARRLLKQGKFHILHTHGGTAGFWGRLAALFVPSPPVRIHTYHGLHYLVDNRVVRRSHRVIDRLLLRSTDAVICVCRSDLEKGMDAGVVNVENTEVINYGIEIERFRATGKREAVRSQLGVGNASVVFANIGRLHAQKGQRYLLEAFHAVRKALPDSVLWIIGEGSLREELERQAGDLGIENAVRFLGARADIPEILSAMDVFVLPSLWEGQPISLLEAMAAGRPVIASAVDGIRDVVVDGQNGLLVPAEDSGALASAMLRLVRDKSLTSRLSERAAGTVTELFSANTMARRVGTLYERLYRSRFDPGKQPSLTVRVA